jgi:hypothetical protein
MSQERSRFLLAPAAGCAVLLDLETGALCRLGGSAVAIARGLAEGQDLEAVARRLSRDTGIDEVRARSDVASVWGQITATPPDVPTEADVTFRAGEGGFEMRHQGRPVLHLDRDGARATWRGERTAGPDAEWRLRQALPHLLMLRGQPVLHAAAVQRGRGALAISGATGAGKSTLAGLLSGGSPLCEDLTLIRVEPVGGRVLPGGEAEGRRWSSARAGELRDTGRTLLSDAHVETMARGPSLALEEIWFLDAAHRGGESIDPEKLAEEETLVALLRNGFGELAVREVWRLLFETSRALAAQVGGARVRVPATRPELAEAARRYREKVAS